MSGRYGENTFGGWHTHLEYFTKQTHNDTHTDTDKHTQTHTHTHRQTHTQAFTYAHINGKITTK